MKKVYTHFLLFIALFFSVSHVVFSQVNKSDKREIKRLLKRGDKYYGLENYHLALENYEQALSLDSSQSKALYYAGISRLMLFGSKKGLEYLEKYGRQNEQVDKHYHYWLGRAYHLDMQFDKADENYNRYAQELSSNDSRLEEIRKLKLQTGFGRTYVNNYTDFYAKPLGAPLNSRYSDHSPILTGDRQTLIFTSKRTENKRGEEITPKGDAFENIYVAKGMNGDWGKPMIADKNINNRRQHTSNVQLFDNDNKMLIYKSVGYGSMFFTEKEGDRWSKPKKFNKYMSTARYEPNGFVIKNESVVYFSSGRESKNGNLDLFVSRRDSNNTWSAPERLPGFINTDADEDAPYLADDGLTLYFCSRGHDSMGGFDVFKTTYDPAARTWSKPLNMGYPINTPADDIYFIADSLNREFYLSSNREGTTGEEDLFAVRLYGSVVVKGIVTDKRSGIPLSGITMNFVAQRKPEMKVALSTGSEGAYSTGLRSNYAYNVEIRNNEGDILLLDVLEIAPSYEEDAQLTKNYQLSLPSDALALQGQRIRVENLNLVKMQYEPSDTLILYGIVNSTQGMVADAQVRIRREDSRDILYETQTDDEGAYNFRFQPNDKTDYVIEIYKSGYLLNSIAVLYNENVDARAKGNQLELESTMVNSVDANTSLTEIKVGANQVLGGVYFEFNSAKLLPESSIALDKLVAFLKENHTITMEIGGHTDDLGSEQINKQMSLRRAQSVVNYLIQRGVPRRRLVAAGYGETQPITPNESALNGRDVNRRVEVTILSK